MRLTLLLLFFSTQSFGAILAKNSWPVNELRVCFSNFESKREFGTYKFSTRPWVEKNKKLVQEWVTSEYTPERTGIHFSGWEDCEASSQSDVVIFLAKKNPLVMTFIGGTRGLATVGQAALNTLPDYPEARGYVILSTTNIKKGTTIHEFGHVAGLAHEHIHPEAHARSLGCKDTEKNQKKYSNYVYEAYDVHSIMNYCTLHGPAGDSMGLSAQDKRSLKQLYATP